MIDRHYTVILKAAYAELNNTYVYNFNDNSEQFATYYRFGASFSKLSFDADNNSNKVIGE